MGNYGIKIGDNIQTDSDLDLQFSSEFSSLKLYKWGNAQFTTDASAIGSVEIEHDLDYTPIVFVYQKFNGQYTFLSSTTYPDSFSLVGQLNSYNPTSWLMQFYANDEKIVIQTLNIGGSSLDNEVLPNTTYYFRYYILVDKSQVYSAGSNIDLSGDYGFKVSLPGKDVKTAEEYDMAYSSKYKALQFYGNHILSSTLTLPAMWATYQDDEVEAATYVDFNHNLGYQPLVLAYADTDDLGVTGLREIPFLKIFPLSFVLGSVYEELSVWADSSKVRVLFKRYSNYPVLDGSSAYAFAEKTVNVKVIIFAEDLTGWENT
jgi:hypothetical protein